MSNLSTEIIQSIFVATRNELIYRGFSIVTLLYEGLQNHSCKVFHYPGQLCDKKNGQIMMKLWTLDLQLKQAIDDAANEYGLAMRPYFRRLILPTEFERIVTVRCAYLSIDCADEEVAQCPKAISKFFEDVLIEPSLASMIFQFGETLTNTVAVAANFWRIHTCGKPLLKILHNARNHCV